MGKKEDDKLDRIEELVWRLIEVQDDALSYAQEHGDEKRIASHSGTLTALVGIALKIIYARMKLGEPPKDELLERLARIPEREPRRVYLVETASGVRVPKNPRTYKVDAGGSVIILEEPSL